MACLAAPQSGAAVLCMTTQNRWRAVRTRVHGGYMGAYTWVYMGAYGCIYMGARLGNPALALRGNPALPERVPSPFWLLAC